MAVEKIWFGIFLFLCMVSLGVAGEPGIPSWASNLRNPFLCAFLLAALFFAFSRRFRALIFQSIHHPESLISERQEKQWTGGVLVFYLFFFLKLSYHNFSSFNVEAIDFSIFDFMLANTARGRFMESVLGTNHFGTHFTPVLFLLYPLHRLWTHPFVLLFAHPVILWAAGFPLVRLLKINVRAPLHRCLILFAFFNFNYLAQVLNYNFHMEVFYVPGFFWLFWSLQERRWFFFSLSTLFLFSIKEDAAIYLASAAVGIPFSFSVPWSVPLSLFVVSVSVFMINMRWAIPYFRGSSDYQIADAAAAYGHTLREIIPNMLSHWRQILSDVLFGKWVSMAGGFLFLPFLILFVLISMLPFAVICTLANSHVMKNVMLYYSAPYIPFLFFGYCLCLGKDRLPLVGLSFPVGAKSLAVGFTLLFLTLTGGSYLSIRTPRPEMKWVSSVRSHLRLAEPLCIQGVIVPHIGYPSQLRLLRPDCLTRRPFQALLHLGLSPFPYSLSELATFRQGFEGDPQYLKQTFGGFELYTRRTF
jgi:hypothetical protein